jgi:hypothetical protein
MSHARLALLRHLADKSGLTGGLSRALASPRLAFPVDRAAALVAGMVQGAPPPLEAGSTRSRQAVACTSISRISKLPLTIFDCGGYGSGGGGSAAVSQEYEVSRCWRAGWLSGRPRRESARDWLRVHRLPPYAHELNPVEQVWSHLKRSPVNLAKRNLVQLTALARTPAQTDAAPARTPGRLPRQHRPGPHTLCNLHY